MAHALITGALGLVLVAACPRVLAGEALPDPTRPPAAVANHAAGGEKVKAPAEALVLQSVLVSPSRKVAIISGTPLMPGGRIHDHTLIDVTPTGVLLDGPEGRIGLKLFGGDDRRAVKTAHTAPTPRATTRGSPRP
ncbi:MAG: hypothetical protein U1F52_16620 [Burkholderiales bacterium]